MVSLPSKSLVPNEILLQEASQEMESHFSSV